MDRARLVAAFALPIAVVVGGVGAGAFNPDSGAVVHSVVLWHIFGIMCEGGMFLLVVSVVVLALLAVLRKTLAVTRSSRS